MALNKEQQQVYKWLSAVLGYQGFADAYRGAVLLLCSKQAGYVTFVSHAGRDFMNILASEVAGIKLGSRVDYVKQINNIQNEWQYEWRKTDVLIQDVDERGHYIPTSVCLLISTLIDEHKAGQERDGEKATLFFSTFLDYSEKEAIPKNFLGEWKSAKKWFEKHTHLRGETYHENMDEELAMHFACLHNYLHIAASSQYDRLKGLNEILGATN